MSTTRSEVGNERTDVSRVFNAKHQRFEDSVEETGARVHYTHPCSRWTKHGHDRIYFDDHDGYVDLKSGAVKEGAPITNVRAIQSHNTTWKVYYMCDSPDVANEAGGGYPALIIERQ